MSSWMQALFDQQTPLPNDIFFYRHILEDDDVLANAAQIYYLLKKQKKLSQTPLFFQERIKQNYEKSLMQNMFIKHQTNQILQQFEEQGIDVITLKGVGFSEEYFGDIGARPTSDIDLLIKQPDLNKAKVCVKSLGYMLEQEPIAYHFHYSLSKIIPHSPIPLTVELHWDVLKENTSNFNIKAFWDQATSVTSFQHIKQLSQYHTFYFICLHGWRHNLQSMKYYIDIVQMIHKLRNDLDYNILLQDAHAHKTWRRIIRTLSIVYAELPFLQEVKQFSYKKIRLKNKYMDYLDYQIFSYDSAKHSIIEFIHWVISSTLAKLR